MNRALTSLPLGLLAAAVILTPSARAGDIGYVEDFALAPDRAAALKPLIPGTDDAYYYHALHLLNTEQYAAVRPVLATWAERHGRTARLVEIEVRHALLGYDADPKRAFDYLTAHLGVTFPHQRETAGGRDGLPTALDQKLVGRDTLRAAAFARRSGLDPFEDSALDWLARTDLSWERRRELLHRLKRPDVPNLPALVDADLKAPHASPFGSVPVHTMLTPDQLKELLKLAPDLVNDGLFVRTWASKLRPGADTDWRRDRAAAKAYLERLEAFTAPLPPVHNALKAHVLYHRLALDRALGVADKGRFLAYLRLPRFQPYMARDWGDRPEARDHPADLSADFDAFTLLPPVRADEPLVRAYLQHFLADAASPAEFEPYVDAAYLNRLFAETKVENGLGDPEVWASRLSVEPFVALRDRVDIDFAPTNKTDFAADEPVRLDVVVKNVPTLLVKVFEVNAANYYRSRQREVDTDLNLDGLVPNAEQTHRFDASPLRRVARTFPLPELDKPGVYVVDFIGGGRSSRAVVRKGRLRPVVTTGTAGQSVVVVDGANRPVPHAAVTLGGVEYPCDANGRAVVPFSSAPGRRPVVLSHGPLASLDTIDHQGETYRLVAGIHVDRESLLAGRTAAVVVRPGLFLNDRPVSVKLLDEVKLRLVATDGDGISTTTEVPAFELFEDRESAHEFRVPARLRQLGVTLTATVKSLSLGKPVDVAASESFALNGIDATDATEDLHLAKFGPDYAVEVLGRTGEVKAGRPVQVAVKHRDFKEVVNVTLKTDGRGRVTLGPLAEVAAVTATGPAGTSHTWPLPADHHSYRDVLHATSGATVAVPYLGAADKPSRDELALLEVRPGSDGRGEVIAADRFDALALTAGMVEARGLPPGDYLLTLKRDGATVRIRVAAGPTAGGYVLGSRRDLQLPGLKPTGIAAVVAEGDGVAVRLTGVNRFTRVHVFATRYAPAYSPFAGLGRVRDGGLVGVIPTRPESAYITGRDIGDEYRYVLDRRGAKKFPGNMLDRPQLLLNPWAIRTTEAGEQHARDGGEFKRVPPARDSVLIDGTDVTRDRVILNQRDLRPGGPAAFAALDFLADPSAVLLNLVPDKDGVVRVGRKQLGPHPWVHVAAVDPLSTTVRSVSLGDEPVKAIDLRLRDGLDPAGHFARQKRVTVLSAGTPFALADVGSSRFEAFDSLPKVHTLFRTLSNDPKLAEFAFVLNWPKLKEAEKRDLLSKHACHELHFFLMKRDPAFFAAVVRPFLANKKDKTFLDHYLLGDDVGGYLDPWRYGRLNTVERVLLARAVAGEGEKTARHLADLLALLPPDAARDARLFDTAVKRGDLSVGGDVLLVPRTVLVPYAPPTPRPPVVIPTVPEPTAPPPPPTPAPVPPADPGLAKEEAAGKRPKSRGGWSDRNKDAKELTNEDLALDKAADAPAEFFEDDRRKLAELRQLYRNVDTTKEWAENNYHKLRQADQTAALVPVGPFWVDYARHAGNGPFLSPHFAAASRSFTEMMFALSVLDLPFEPAKHQLAFTGPKMDLGPAGPIVAFHEEVQPVAAPDGKIPVLVGQNFYRPADRYRVENGETVDKYVTGEFLVNTVYGCQVVVTNPTSSRQRLNVLVQVPVGAVPLANGQFTRSVPLDLEPYHTRAVDYHFYFPQPGKFAHLPAQVARGEKLVAAAKPTPLDVRETPSKADTSAWDYVSQHGSDDDVIGFLNRENVNGVNLDRVAFRMKGKAFFERAVALLRGRHVYSPTLWSYGLFHKNAAVAKEFLAHSDRLANEVGGPIDTPLFTLDPVARVHYEHLEYKPLVNARAHSLGRRRQIVNEAVLDQYHRLLKLLTYRKTLDDADHLAVTYYLLLQDRVEEATAAFGRVNPDRVATRLQYDYCAAYLALSAGDPERARAVASRHADEPVDHWRKLFTSVVSQADEATGRGPQIAADPGRDQNRLAATEPAFELTATDAGASLTWQNLSAATVNYYPMDVELLFSRKPFAGPSDGQFAFTRPHATTKLALPADKPRVAIPIPAELANRNVLVEVTAAGKARAVPHFAAAMDVKLTESYGQVTVADAGGGKPLPKVYVKVYAKRADGSVAFHKDGYTDLRGRFDYASVNAPDTRPVERFAVLVLGDDRGAVIREAVPPQP